MCEMCVFRYRQHTSRDKLLGPHHPLFFFTPTHLSLSTHHTSVCVWPCECVCVCVLVFTSDIGSVCLAPRHLQGGNRKRQLCAWETENIRKREWREMPVKTVTVGVSTNHVTVNLPPFPPVLLSAFLITLSITLLQLSSCFGSFFYIRYKISDVLHL